MDDEFNVISSYEDAPTIAYTSDDVQEENIVALTRLNNMGMNRAAKRARNELERYPSDEVCVHPIDWHMTMDCGKEERDRKRAKKEADEECVERTTVRIIQARDRRTKGWTMESKRREDKEFGVDEEDDDASSLVLWRPPIDGSPWIGISGDESNDRQYVRLFQTRKISGNMDKYKNNTMRKFTAISFEKLISEVHQLKARRIEAIKLYNEKEETEKENINTGESLWVNKYSPNHFMHLLSPDGVNRQVVQWLRLWDECVFRKKIPDSLLEDESFSMDEGSPRRPIKRILVLSGQAGLGKTTLAKIAAKMVGYSVVETNASDNRNVADLEKVIESAGRTSKTLDGECRPMCIILDEVDGAPIDTIRWLVKLVNSNEKMQIRRPIIAICNNLYTSSLRELRSISIMVTMGETKRNRLVERLAQIVDEERLMVDQSALETLARLSSTDIRLSLNVLQYLSLAANSKNRKLTSSEVELAMDKVRPPMTNIFGHWSTILEWARHLDKKGSVLPLDIRLQKVERVVTEEDGDKLITGIHHNYLSIPNVAPNTLSATSRIFSSIDQIFATVMAKKTYMLYKYMRMEYLSLHATIATHAKATLQFPTHMQNIQLRGKQSEETVSMVGRSMSRMVPKRELVLDTLPLLVSILQPPIKTANRSLFTKQEEMIVKRIVDCLRACGLNFAPLIQDGVINYIFSPPIDVLTMFSITNAHRRMLSNNQRKMIAHEVVLSSVRHSPSLNPSHSLDCNALTDIPLSRISKGNSEKTRPMGTLVLQSSLYFSTQSNVPLHFRYNNCFSNAVKRNVKMFQLLN